MEPNLVSLTMQQPCGSGICLALAPCLSAVYLTDRERWPTTPAYSMATESPGDPVSSDTTPLRPDSPCHGTSRAAEGKARWPVDHHQK